MQVIRHLGRSTKIDTCAFLAHRRGCPFVTVGRFCSVKRATSIFFLALVCFCCGARCSHRSHAQSPRGMCLPSLSRIIFSVNVLAPWPLHDAHTGLPLSGGALLANPRTSLCKTGRVSNSSPTEQSCWAPELFLISTAKTAQDGPLLVVSQSRSERVVELMHARPLEKRNFARSLLQQNKQFVLVVEVHLTHTKNGPYVRSRRLSVWLQ